MIRIGAQRLYEIMDMLLIAAGLEEGQSHQVAENLLQADLRGVNTHGVMRLYLYLGRLANGAVKARPNLRILRERKAVALLDGDHGLGQISGQRGMELAMAKAAEYGIGLVSVIHGHHFGAAAYYAGLAGQRDMIGIALSNTPPLMAPWGGKKALVGNNPYAVCIPAGEEYPVLLDMAFSQVAQGKISLALAKEENIPDGWALDREGQPTNDPQAAMAGLLLPAGGYKGYGQAVIADLLAGLLPGAAVGAGVLAMMNHPTEQQNSGQMYIAIDIAAFREPDHFKQDVDRYIREMKACPKAAGTDEIFLPGEHSWRRMEENRRNGILLPAAVFTQLAQAGDLVGVDIRPLIPEREKK